MTSRRSKSQSPEKANPLHDRTPLSWKDSNVFGSGSSSQDSSPLKVSFPRLLQSSRSKELKSSLSCQENSLTPSKGSPKRPSSFGFSSNVSLSPTKKLKPNNTPSLSHSLNTRSKSFEIFEDANDYNKKLRSKFEDSLRICDVSPGKKENMLPYMKHQEEEQSGLSENIYNDKIPQRILERKRYALHDLSIMDYPGYAQVPKTRKDVSVLNPKFQLTNSWVLKFRHSKQHSMSTRKIPIPSFVTPPKRRGFRFKYVTSLDQRKHYSRAMSGRHSDLDMFGYFRSEIEPEAVADITDAKKTLRFPIYDDNIKY